MAVEYLQYIRVDETRTGSEIIVQLTRGGNAARFIKGISSANVAHLLHDLADRLERGVSERASVRVTTGESNADR